MRFAPSSVVKVLKQAGALSPPLPSYTIANSLESCNSRGQIGSACRLAHAGKILVFRTFSHVFRFFRWLPGCSAAGGQGCRSPQQVAGCTLLTHMSAQQYSCNKKAPLSGGRGQVFKTPSQSSLFSIEILSSGAWMLTVSTDSPMTRPMESST